MSKKHKTRGNGDRSFQSNGKGDADRTTDVDAFRRNFDEINWGKRTSAYTKAWKLRGLLQMMALLSVPFDSHTRGS